MAIVSAGSAEFTEGRQRRISSCTGWIVFHMAGGAEWTIARRDLEGDQVPMLRIAQASEPGRHRFVATLCDARSVAKAVLTASHGGAVRGAAHAAARAADAARSRPLLVPRIACIPQPVRRYLWRVISGLAICGSAVLATATESQTAEITQFIFGQPLRGELRPPAAPKPAATGS